MASDRRCITTRGGSMFPFIPARSLIYLEATPVPELIEGDVVAFIGSDGAAVAHRLLRVQWESTTAWPPAPLLHQAALRQAQARPGRPTALIVAGDQSARQERVAIAAYMGRVHTVQWRHFRYRTRGLAGQLMAQVALHHRRSHACLTRTARFFTSLRKSR